jgi:hypothetical protein
MKRLTEAEIKELAQKAAPKTTPHVMRGIKVSRREVTVKDGKFVISAPVPARGSSR